MFRRAVTRLLGLSSLVLLGCSGDAFTTIGPLLSDAAPVEAGGPDGAEADSRTDGGGGDAGVEGDAEGGGSFDSGVDGACPYSGSGACSDVVSAYCAHYESCCIAMPGNGYCATWGSQASNCKTYWKNNSFDCSAGKYSKAVCTSGTSCASSVQTATCTTIFQSTGPDSAAFGCGAFWGQF